MGGVKGEVTDAPEGCLEGYGEWIDEVIPPPSELEMERIKFFALVTELSALKERMTKNLDRFRYYGEKIDEEEFDFLTREVERLLKEFSET